ncbi:tripartite tricarboxylate transporter substrate binding protein [Nocardiopsis sediminis]|uniref:Tripartite tricarboxylate transporter substrate binding protein n=1 Tax=Nocardiopsis sediminis TaxID=1778267 RepID=A0ABV8FU18_9ACTN
MGTRRTAAVAAALLLTAGTGACSGAAGSDEAGTSELTGDATMVVPFGAGGGSDVAGRTIAAGLEAATGTTVTVENRDGGAGAIGYTYLMSKRGDPNYLLSTETALLTLPMTADTEYDYTDFTPIMSMGEDFTLLVVAPDSPIEGCADAVATAKEQRVVAGVAGAASLDNAVFTMVEQDTGAQFDRVPFESGSEVMASLLAGRIDIASLNPSEVLGQLESGDLRALCVAADERYDYAALADIPTAKEEGIDVSYGQFRGLLAPGGISGEAAAHWEEASREFVGSDAYDDYITANLLQPGPLYGEDFRAYLDDNRASLEEVLNP